MICGELKLIRLLGRGGMSEVWEAENRRLGSRHAVKVYAYPKKDAEVEARFVQEGRMLAKLSHPRIVRVTDVGTTDEGRPYFVMDLVVNPEGKPQTLGDVPDGSADELTIGRWYDDIRDGLAYIHSKGIIHRDLKLQNVMVGSDGHAVLTDFGIAHVANAQEGGGAVVDPVSTLVAIRDGKKPLMGSIGYMAPELEMGCAATERSDWYALGVVVYKLLTGTWCDARTDIVGTLETYDPTWAAIIPKLLHANPAGRECLSFAEIHAQMNETAAAEAEERFLQEKRRGHLARHVARWAGGLVALLAIALVMGMFEFKAERRSWRQRMQLSGARVDVPTFDDLFGIPAAAKAEESTDDNGNVNMPSRKEFEASRIDALVLAQPILSMLATSVITPERAIAEFEKIADSLEEDSEKSPLEGLEFGESVYMQMGDNTSLRFLFRQAVEKLRARSDIE